VDRLGIHYQVQLDSTIFLIQKKAELIFPKLAQLLEKNEIGKAKRMISQIMRLIANRAQKGITDKDAILEKNYGWLIDKAIHIDVGRFAEDKRLCSVINTKHEIVRITHSLKEWLEKNSPELLNFYEKELKEIEKQ
jgi:hypothetical protein